MLTASVAVRCLGGERHHVTADWHDGAMSRPTRRQTTTLHLGTARRLVAL